MLLSLSLLSAISSPVPNAAQYPVPAAVADVFAADAVKVDRLTIPYRLMSPAKVEEGKRYPVVLFLHGAGERGDDEEEPGGERAYERHGEQEDGADT